MQALSQAQPQIRWKDGRNRLKFVFSAGMGTFLPSAEHLKRFKELGGEIVTVGSDAHDASRMGQYVPEALDILKDIFGYVCTFEDRKPIFHKL